MSLTKVVRLEEVEDGEKGLYDPASLSASSIKRTFIPGQEEALQGISF